MEDLSLFIPLGMIYVIKLLNYAIDMKSKNSFFATVFNSGREKKVLMRLV